MPLFGRKNPTLPIAAPVRVEAEVQTGTANEPVIFEKNGTINLAVRSLPDAKRAQAMLKLHKKELALQKRAVMDQERQLRAAHTDHIRRQSSLMRGGGGVGKFVRGVQQAGRASERAHLANALRPLEEQRRLIDAQINLADSALLKVEGYIAQTK